MTTPDPELTSSADLKIARQQLHVYEAITIAANDAHAVLDIMLSASGPDAARRGLQERYNLTEVQAGAVMEMQFRRLTSADRHNIEQQHNELAAQIAVLEREA